MSAFTPRTLTPSQFRDYLNDQDEGLEWYIRGAEHDAPILRTDLQQLETEFGIIPWASDKKITTVAKLPATVVEAYPQSTRPATECFMGSYSDPTHFGEAFFIKSGDRDKTPDRVAKFMDFFKYADEVLRSEGVVTIERIFEGVPRTYLFWTHLTEDETLKNWSK